MPALQRYNRDVRIRFLIVFALLTAFALAQDSPDKTAPDKTAPDKTAPDKAGAGKAAATAKAAAARREPISVRLPMMRRIIPEARMSYRNSGFLIFPIIPSRRIYRSSIPGTQ